jgi:hypothetical protein
MQKTEVTAVKPSGEQMALSEAVASKPEQAASPAASNTASNNTANNASSGASSQAPESRPESLPQTASELPLISMLGMGSLGLAALADYLRRRVI